MLIERSKPTQVTRLYIIGYERHALRFDIAKQSTTIRGRYAEMTMPDKDAKHFKRVLKIEYPATTRAHRLNDEKQSR